MNHSDSFVCHENRGIAVIAKIESVSGTRLAAAGSEVDGLKA